MSARQPGLERAGFAIALLITAFIAACIVPLIIDAFRAPSTRALVSIVQMVIGVGVAMVVPTLVGVGAAAFISECCSSRLRNALTLLIECLAVVPGVVYAHGSIGLPVSVREAALIGRHSGTMMVIFGVVAPTIALLSLYILRSVPARLRDAAVALGATKGDVLVSVVLPVTRRAILGACAFGFVRALGETSALLAVSYEGSPVRELGMWFCKGDADCVGSAACARIAILATTGLLSVLAFRLVRRRVALEEV